MDLESLMPMCSLHQLCEQLFYLNGKYIYIYKDREKHCTRDTIKSRQKTLQKKFERFINTLSGHIYKQKLFFRFIKYLIYLINNIH